MSWPDGLWEKHGCQNWRDNMEAFQKTFVWQFQIDKHGSSVALDSE